MASKLSKTNNNLIEIEHSFRVSLCFSSYYHLQNHTFALTCKRSSSIVSLCGSLLCFGFIRFIFLRIVVVVLVVLVAVVIVVVVVVVVVVTTAKAVAAAAEVAPVATAKLAVQ